MAPAAAAQAAQPQPQEAVQAQNVSDDLPEQVDTPSPSSGNNHQPDEVNLVNTPHYMTGRMTDNEYVRWCRAVHRVVEHDPVKRNLARWREERAHSKAVHTWASSQESIFSDALRACRASMHTTQDGLQGPTHPIPRQASSSGPFAAPEGVAAPEPPAQQEQLQDQCRPRRPLDRAAEHTPQSGQEVAEDPTARTERLRAMARALLEQPVPTQQKNGNEN